MTDRELVDSYLRASGRLDRRPLRLRVFLVWILFAIVPIVAMGAAAAACAFASNTPPMLDVAFPLGGMIAGLVLTSFSIRSLLPSLRGFRTACFIAFLVCFDVLGDLLEAQLLPSDPHGTLFRCALLLLFGLGLLVVVLPTFVSRALAK